MNPLEPLLRRLAGEFGFAPGARAAADIIAPEPAQVPILAALAYANSTPETSNLTPETNSPTIAVVPTSAIAELVSAELAVWLGDQQVEHFCAWETFPFEKVSPTFVSMGQRLRILWRLRTPSQQLRAVVVPARAFTQRLVPDSLKVAPIGVRVGQTIDRDKLVEQLVSGGYRRGPQVEHCGNLAVRGSIVDVYGSNLAHPVRLDFWGDTIERMVEFSLSDQRSLGDLEAVEFFPCRELLPTDPVRQRASQLMSQAPWASQWWQQLERGEMFDGMESYLPWLIDEELVLADILTDDSLLVRLDDKWLAGRAQQIQQEESQLTAAFAETWIGAGAWDGADRDSANLPAASDLPPPLHVSMERALQNFPGTQIRLEASSTRSSSGGRVPPAGPTKIKARAWSQLQPNLPSQSSSPSQPNFAAAGYFPAMGDLLEEGYSITITAHSPGSAERIANQLQDHNIHLPILNQADGETSGIITAPLQQGFVLDQAKLAVLTESDITGKRRHQSVLHRRKTSGSASGSGGAGGAGKGAGNPGPTNSTILQDSIPFDIGSYVVHRKHGIARYAGIKTHEIDGVLGDYLSLEYRGTDKLFVPIEQLDAVQPYTSGQTPKLSRMGGSDWKRTTGKARAAAAEVADELIALYQHREIATGFAFASDSVWQTELEASFPFEETPDQLHAITQVKRDMEQAQPMDRLVCGDVGFGKTEVALRAAFKAIESGKQVAMLVPTTLLAQQHFDTFQQRFASFGVRMEMLSRFVSPAKAKATLNGLAAGDVKLIIGTHRLLSGDVQFHDLGLLILDEEHRFGVKHKEQIKTLRTSVDVLAMTATPIPRTLEMSLVGIRDFSPIQTPPQDRQPIFTYVGNFDRRAVAEAIKRELLREGQAFYVHNHVHSIHERARELTQLVPEARFAVAHGRMEAAQLEQVVADFVDGQYDVLVCTTIIESGIDIASANTLIVEDAHKFGLAQLHQLRGRVGRSHLRAYAYLFIPEDLGLSQQAYERLKTIEEHTELGAGSLVAMRDLELRGAGNLLGVGQSGHIAAVGYDLYCQLVSEKIAELKGEPPPSRSLELELDLLRQSHLPAEYMPHEANRLEAYRNVAAVRTEAEAEDLKEQWRDRFGPLPPEALALLDIARLRAACFVLGLRRVKVRRDGRGGGRGQALCAQIAPLDLALSRVARLERRYPGSSYDPQGQVLNLVLQDEVGAAAEILEALAELAPAPAPEAD